MRLCSMITALAAALALQFASLQAEQRSSTWNQFRGPNGSGVAVDCRPPVLLDAEQATWQVDVPPGHSSPVLSRQLVLLTAVEGERLVTLAYRRQTGELACARRPRKRNWKRCMKPTVQHPQRLASTTNVSMSISGRLVCSVTTTKGANNGKWPFPRQAACMVCPHRRSCMARR